MIKKTHLPTQRQLPLAPRSDSCLLSLPLSLSLPLPLTLLLTLSLLLTWVPVDGDTSMGPKSDKEASAV